MKKEPITKSDVKQAIVDLKAKGIKPTLEAIHSHLGRGSMTTIQKHKHEMETEAENEHSAEALGVFNQMWKEAVSLARKQNQDVIDSLRADLTTINNENQRLEMEMDKMVEQAEIHNNNYNRVRNDLAKANQSLADALKKQTEIQEECYKKGIELERIKAKMEMGAQPTAPESAKQTS